MSNTKQKTISDYMLFMSYLDETLKHDKSLGEPYMLLLCKFERRPALCAKVADAYKRKHGMPKDKPVTGDKVSIPYKI